MYVYVKQLFQTRNQKHFRLEWNRWTQNKLYWTLTMLVDLFSDIVVYSFLKKFGFLPKLGA